MLTSPSAAERRTALEADVSDFLAAGGEIEQIPADLPSRSQRVRGRWAWRPSDALKARMAADADIAAAVAEIIVKETRLTHSVHADMWAGGPSPADDVYGSTYNLDLGDGDAVAELFAIARQGVYGATDFA